MNDRKKTKRKLFNIFEKDKICNSLNEINHSDVKSPTFNLKLTARRRSTRLKSEIFVERIPPESPENDPYAFTKNDFEDTKLVYTPPKKKAKISKSPSFMERIDRYFNIQPSKASNTLSANSCCTTSDATEEAEKKIDKTVHSKASNSPKLKEDDDLQEYNDSFIDSIDTNAIVDMLNNTEIVESQSQVKNEDSKNIATPKKYDRKSNENLNPIVRSNSKERKVSSKENNNLQKRKAKSNTSKKNQYVVESPVDSIHTNAIIDSIDTNAVVDMLNNTEIVESQSQVKNEDSKNIATPKKYDRKSNENLNPIVRLNSKERKLSSKENNNLQKRKAKSNTSKNNQNIVESPVDSIHTNAKVDMVNNSEIVEEKSQVQNEIPNCNTTPKKYHTSKERDKKPKENFKTIVNLKTTERKVSCKENKNLQATKTRSKTTKKNQNDEDYIHTLQPLRTRGRKAKFSACQLEHDDYVGSKNNDALNITNIFNTQKKIQESSITETSASLTSSPEKSVENKISVSLRKRERRQTISSIQMDNNVTKANSSQQLSASLTSSLQKTIENERFLSLRKKSRRQTISGIQMDNNVAEVTKTNDCSQLPSTSLTSSPQKTVENERSVSLRKRGRRQSISGIQMDNNVAEVKENHASCHFPAASLISRSQKSVENQKSVSLRKRGRRPTISGIQMNNNDAEVKETNDSSQFQSASLTLSPQKTVKNEISATIRKRGRRQTICGIQMDNNVAEVTETNDSSQLPSASMTSSPQKTLKNEISAPIRKRGRRPTITGIKMDNNITEITETNDSSQFPAASLTSSPQKTVKNEISVSIRKRGRRQTICGIQMDNNAAEVTETNDSSQLPSPSMTSSLQKTVENKRSESLRKRVRRPTISGIQMDNNIAEVTENNDSSQFPSASLASSRQKTVENEISVPLRRRDRRQTICGIQMDNNIAEVTETNDSSQLPRKRGRRPTICQTKLENYFTREAKKTDESSLDNQTEINSDKNVTKIITKNLDEKCISKLNDDINSMTNNASDEQNTHRLPSNHKEKLPTGSQQVKKQSIKPQKIRSTDPNDNKVVEEPKRKRGRPRLSPNEKQVKMRIQKINVAKKPKNTYGRLSKDKLNSPNVRRIPKDRLDEVLDMLQNEDHEIWKDRNISCNAGIHRYWETRTMTSDQNMKMKYARQFLLRRDWLNLSKILCLSNQDPKNNIYYPLLVKYATLCLAHTDKEQFHKFVNSLITMADSSAIIKKCTKISRENEE